MSADAINGIFELIGGSFIAMSCMRLYRDKQVKGVCIPHIAFFSSWGWWSLFFYASVGTWWSFLGGLSVAVSNGVWLLLMIYYSARRQPS